MIRNAFPCLAAAAFCAICPPLAAQETSDGPSAEGAGAAQPAAQDVFTLSPAELFEFAEQARADGNFDLAAKAYTALTELPDMPLRNEARFRHAMMLADQQQDYRGAAVLLRQILDEQPDTARVRVELARMQAMMGNLGAAEKELRAAQAAGLPPEVERLVRFYASALNARKPFGFNIDFAIAPDSNINRATRSDTLGTIIGDFQLSEDAQEKSGIGIAARGQAYLKAGLAENAELLVRASANGRFYENGDFDDYIASIQAGPQIAIGKDRLDIAATASWRWFGRDPYTVSYGATANYRHPVGKRAQINVQGAAIRTKDRLNDLRSNDRYQLELGLDRAFTSKFGGGVSLSGYRAVANDPGYSTASGSVNTYLFRELGRTTAVLRAGYDRLEADKRLFLYPRRRVDDRFSASLSGTFRDLRIGAFAPLAKISYERNFSTVEIYDYQRVAAEFGVAAAF